MTAVSAHEVLEAICARSLRPSGGRRRVRRHLRERDRPRNAAHGVADAPVGDGGLEAASAVGRGKLYRHYDELLQGPACRRPGAAHLLRHVGAHALPERASHARRCCALAGGAGDQRERPRPRPTKSRSATTTSSRLRSRSCSSPTCSSCSPTRAALLRGSPTSSNSAEADHGRAALDELEGYEIGLSTSPLGSGGMRSKVVAAEMATAAGIPVTIASGVDREAVAAAPAGTPGGTRFVPRPAACRASSCGSSTRSRRGPARGRRGRGACAARARRSLLPVGVVEVEGEFEAGDAVEVRCNGRAVGKGIVGYSAEAAPDQGPEDRPGARAAAAGDRRAVHRDYFVLE